MRVCDSQLAACSFCQRTFKIATPSATLRHFVESYTEYLESNVVHSRDRENGIISPFEGLIDYRRHNVGDRSLFFFGESGPNLPDGAYYHPVIREMRNYAIDLLGIENVSSNSNLSVTKAATLFSPSSRIWRPATLNRYSARFIGIL